MGFQPWFQQCQNTNLDYAPLADVFLRTRACEDKRARSPLRLVQFLHAVLLWKTLLLQLLFSLSCILSYRVTSVISQLRDYIL